MLPGRIVAPLDGAFVRVATLALEKELQVLTPAEPANRFGVSSQSFLLAWKIKTRPSGSRSNVDPRSSILDPRPSSSYSPPFRRAATGMGDRRAVLAQTG